MEIRPLKNSDLEKLKDFTDLAIGTGYYKISELEEIYKKSISKNTNCTLVLEDDQKILGVRITYPAGQWSSGKGKGLTPENWPHPLSETAYFQSLFIHPSLINQGWGKKMSLAAIELLKKIGTKGIVCHSWKESPDDSSGRYLRSLKFELIATHPLYWKDVDYTCTRCGKPCLCTADEMYLDLTTETKKENT